MKKILTIEKCRDCWWRNGAYTYYRGAHFPKFSYRCTKSADFFEIPDIDTIPDRCPLEDADDDTP